MRRVTLAVVGMKCDGCAGAVRAALAGVPGVKEVEVRLEEKQARLLVSDDTAAGELVDAVTAAGYEASLLPG